MRVRLDYWAFRLGLRRYCWGCDLIVGPLHDRRRRHGHPDAGTLRVLSEAARMIGLDPTHPTPPKENHDDRDNLD